MPCTLKAAEQMVDFEAKIGQKPILIVKCEALLKEKAHPLCLLVFGDLVGDMGRTGHPSECIQVGHSHAMHPQGHCH